MRPLRPRRLPPDAPPAGNSEMLQAITAIAQVLETRTCPPTGDGYLKLGLRRWIGLTIARFGLWILGWEVKEVVVKE